VDSLAPRAATKPRGLSGLSQLGTTAHETDPNDHRDARIDGIRLRDNQRQQ
jgi:hypothetical protein